jgi:hypothetical protein
MIVDKNKTLALGTVLAFAVLALTGCGGSSSDGDANSDASTEASTSAVASAAKVAFIKEADAVCREADKQTQAKFKAFVEQHLIAENQQPTKAQYTAIGRQILIPALKRQVTKIGALEPPSEDKATIEQFLAEAETAIESAEKNPTVAAESPEKLLADADKLIADYGFKVCGQR